MPATLRSRCKIAPYHALYNDIARLIQDDRRTVGEYIRVVLERHVYGLLKSSG